MSDRSPRTAGRDFGIYALNTWRLADIGAKQALLRTGVGWGNTPVEMVQEDLETGRLVALRLPEWTEAVFACTSFIRPKRLLGLRGDGSWMERFAAQV